MRKKLQQVNTRSAKRHLKKLGHKEARFRQNTNHIISKEIIGNLNAGDTLVLEDLTNIRNNQSYNKDERRKLHSWSFYQLEQFIMYKAAAKGIRVAFVNPAFSSQRCSCCGFTAAANRMGANFKCQECGFMLNADLNGSRNAALQYVGIYKISNWAVVNQPSFAASAARITSPTFSGKPRSFRTR